MTDPARVHTSPPLKKLALGAALAASALVAVPAAFAGGPTVDAKGTEFKPRTVRISKGDKVTWVDKEGFHTVSFKGAFDKELNSPGDKVSRKFNRSGTFKYICRIHVDQGMRGKVVVR